MTLIKFLNIISHKLILRARIFLFINHFIMTPQQESLADDQFDRDFKPKGAMAFFVLLVVLGLIIWFGIYFLMLNRI